MKDKKQLKLGKKIRVGFNKVTIVIISMVIVSVLSNLILVSFARGIYDGPYKEMETVGNIEKNLESLEKNVYYSIAEGDQEKIAKSVKEAEGIKEELQSSLDKLKKVVPKDQISEINKFQDQIEESYPALEKISEKIVIFDAEGNNDWEGALVILNREVLPVFEEAQATLKILQNRSEKAATDYLRNAMIAQVSVICLMAAGLILAILVSGKISRRLEREILTPVNELVEISSSLARGDIDVSITYEKEDEFGVLAKSFREIIVSLKALIAEANSLTHGAIEGKLETRGNAERFNGGYREIIEGVNETLDALVTPLYTSAEYMNRISKGDIPELISEEYKGDFNGIKKSINTCIQAINSLIKDTGMLAGATVRGMLGQRADGSVHGGDFAKIINGINKTLETLVGYIDALPSPFIIIDKEYSILYINKSGADITGFSQEGAVGLKCYDLMKTGDCGKEDCACCKAMLQGERVTRESDAHPNNLNLEISYSGMPIRDENQEIIGAFEIIVDQTEIIKAMKQAERDAEISQKQAEFQDREVENLIVNLEKLGKGDLAIEAIVQEVDDDTRKIGENFNHINDNLKKSIKAIQMLIDDASLMTEAAVEGNLSYRVDSGRHGGSFAKITEGLNQTLDAVIEPVGEALTVLKEMASGNLKVTMDGNYNGGHAEIKIALNKTIENMRSYVDEISDVLSEIGKGNLNIEITADYKGDFVEIKDSLNDIIISLSQLMGGISESAEQVATGSKQVSDSSQTLSQGSTEQASSIEELTASIVEIASQTKQNAVNANQASDLADHVRDNAETGNDQMQHMLSSMTEINESSMNISKIIKVIDAIAFQTNILALNAAVEAARAGQHGKGFAVVAEEVRSLAARSAEAAKNTTALIEGSMDKVEAGTRIANETALALAEIVSGIEQAAGLIRGIAEASNEQASGIAMINKGIEQVSQVVQNNSATAEESAAASEELSSQSELLKSMVERFRINESAKALGGSKSTLLTDGRNGNSGQSQLSSPKILLDGEHNDKY